jgi:DNA-directed RNA polymerase subunit RPC12/RpoP
VKKNVVDLGQITRETVRSWDEKYEKKGDFYRCKECGSRIKQTTVYVSIHAKEFEPAHAGPGRVVKINYPYCPKCDGKIDYAQACYHVPIMKREVIVIDDVTLLLNPGEAR